MFKSVLELQVFKHLLCICLFFVCLKKRNFSLESEEQRLLDRLLRDGKRNGLVSI